MDHAVHAAAREQRRVRGVHSRVHVCFVMSASTTEIRLLLRSALMADHSIEARGTESRGGLQPASPSAVRGRRKLPDLLSFRTLKRRERRAIAFGAVSLCICARLNNPESRLCQSDLVPKPRV